MEIVAGINLKEMHPHVWDSTSEYHLPELTTVMVSYADFHKNRAKRRKAIEQGLHAALGIPKNIQIYLDNGAFYFLTHDGETPRHEYEEFVEEAKPDWSPIPQDFIPVPKMTIDLQRECLNKTMAMNLEYQHNGYVPVIHISPILHEYAEQLNENANLRRKTRIALGGIVPNLLRAPKAMTHSDIFDSLRFVRDTFQDKQVHVFGIGGTATLHLAALLGINTVDSSGWRNRAARGMIQLPGTGERVIAQLGNWRGKELSFEETEILATCRCPACQQHGIDGLKTNKTFGFKNRATHNLWVLLEESRLIQEHLGNGTYTQWYKQHLDNTIYRPLIDRLVELVM